MSKDRWDKVRSIVFKCKHGYTKGHSVASIERMSSNLIEEHGGWLGGQAERTVKNADDLHVMDLQLASEQKEIKKLQDENETLSAANNDLLHEIRVLKNQMNDQTNLRILEFKVQNKQLLKQNKRYCEALEFYAMSGQAIGETKHGEVARKALEGGG